MAKAATKKQEETESVTSSNDILNSVLQEHKEDHYNFQETVTWKVSTGSLLLDVATGGLTPSLWRLCGQNNSGKTPQMLELIRNFLEGVPNSKALWVIAEGRGLSEENRARCGLKFVYSVKEWEVGTVFVLETNVFELVIKLIKDLVKNNETNTRFAFVIDSVDGLILRDDAKKDITEANKVAGVPALSKKMLQSLSLGMFKFGHFMGMISQVTAEIKLDQYAKTPNKGGGFSGGNALLHGSDYILEYSPSYGGDFIMDSPDGKMNDKGGSKPIGQWVKVMLAKSGKEASKKTIITYPVKYGRKPSGIWVEREEREVGDLVFAWGLAKRSGAWISFNDELRKELQSNGLELPEKIQGLEKFYTFLEENTNINTYLFEKFKQLINKSS
jgi:hypothetical protein